jgi:hypothetical protein
MEQGSSLSVRAVYMKVSHKSTAAMMAKTTNECPFFHSSRARAFRLQSSSVIAADTTPAQVGGDAPDASPRISNLNN